MAVAVIPAAAAAAAAPVVVGVAALVAGIGCRLSPCSRPYTHNVHRRNGRARRTVLAGGTYTDLGRARSGNQNSRAYIGSWCDFGLALHRCRGLHNSPRQAICKDLGLAHSEDQSSHAYTRIGSPYLTSCPRCSGPRSRKVLDQSRRCACCTCHPSSPRGTRN